MKQTVPHRKQIVSGADSLVLAAHHRCGVGAFGQHRAANDPGAHHHAAFKLS